MLHLSSVFHVSSAGKLIIGILINFMSHNSHKNLAVCLQFYTLHYQDYFWWTRTSNLAGTHWESNFPFIVLHIWWWEKNFHKRAPGAISIMFLPTPTSQDARHHRPWSYLNPVSDPAPLCHGAEWTDTAENRNIIKNYFYDRTTGSNISIRKTVTLFSLKN